MNPAADDVAGPKPVSKKRPQGLLGQRGKLCTIVIARGARRDLENDFDGASTLESPGAYGWDCVHFGS